MALPGKKRSSSSKRRRAAHHGVETPQLRECSNCHTMQMSHRVCPSCGTYKGRKVIVTRTEKHAQRKRARQKKM